MIRIVYRHNADISQYVFFRFFIKSLVVPLVILLVAGLYCVWTEFTDVIAAIGFAAFTIAMFALLQILVFSNLKKVSKKQEAAVYAHYEMQFSDQGMIYKSFNMCMGINSFVPYHVFKAVRFSAKTLVLVTPSMAFAVSRHDIDQETEQQLIDLLSKNLSKKVFSKTKAPKRSRKAKPIQLVPYTPPAYQFPEVVSLQHDFDRAEDNYFKTLSLKNPYKAKQTKHLRLLIIEGIVLFAVAAVVMVCSFFKNLDLDQMRLGAGAFLIASLFALIIWLNLRAKKKPDQLGRDGAKIELALTQSILSYKILAEQKTTHYFALSEASAIKETRNHLAFYVGAFQPMLLNKKYLTQPQLDNLRYQFTQTLQTKYQYYDV